MLHFIINPKAHSVKIKKLLSLIKEKAEATKRKFKIHYTTHAGHAGEITTELSNEEGAEIIGVGGDGTLHEILNGVTNFDNVTLGLIPSGTGNDFAEAIGLSNKIEKALDIIFYGKAKNTDYIQIGNKRSMNIAGTGMDVDVLERCYRGRIKGKIKYYLSLIQSMFLFKGYEIEYTMNNETKCYNALFACVCNGTQFGGGMVISPEAKVDDQKLNFIIVEWHKGIELIKTFLALMKGKLLSSPRCKQILCEKVDIKPLTDATCNMDGELYPGVDFTAEVRTGLKFIRP